MGMLAEKLKNVEFVPEERVPRTPCYPIYGYGDQEDLEAVNRLRAAGADWKNVQQIVDERLEVSSPIPQHKFIRHWRGLCSCWKTV